MPRAYTAGAVGQRGQPCALRKGMRPCGTLLCMRTHEHGKVLARFVALRRYEVIGVESGLDGFKLSQVSWLNLAPNKLDGRAETPSHATPQRLAKGTRLAACWMYWVFEHVVIPLIRSHFYVTEAEGKRLRVLYYRKRVWSAIEEMAFDTVISRLYQPVLEQPASMAQPASRQQPSSVLGYSALRLLPKHDRAVRPIINLGKRCLPKPNHRRTSINRSPNRVERSHTCMRACAPGSSSRSSVRLDWQRQSGLRSWVHR